MAKTPLQRYHFRKDRIRSKVSGTAERPRLSVYRSLKHIYVQVIDDVGGKTLVSASTHDASIKKNGNKEAALLVGKLIAKKSLDKKIKKVIFDRGGRIFHGRVKAVADGARDGGLEF